MNRNLWLAAGLAVIGSACGGAPTVDSVVQDAMAAIGNPASVQYSATGANGRFGQALTAGEAWPEDALASYVRTIDYDADASRDELNFAVPTFGGQQQVQAVRGDSAWNVGPNGDAPQPAAVDERRLHILLTPHGFLKAAAGAADATLTPGEGENTIAFTALGKYRVEGTIDDQGRVTGVRTAIGTPVMGDTPLEAAYADYAEYGDVQFPTRITISEGGFPIRELTVTDVTPGAALDLPVPEAARNATVPPPQVTTTVLGPGVWFLAGGSHHSLVVEFDDYLAVIEAPLDETRSTAVLAEAARLVPGKPVNYLLTTHHHFDHTGGLRTYAAEGATIVTHASNVPYFEQTLTAPATLSPDMQAERRQAPMLMGVSDEYSLSDGSQTIEVYATDGDTHTNEYTLIYLPGPRVLVEADAFSPGPPDAPVPNVPPPNAVTLYEQIQRLGLDVATIAPIHGRGAVPVEELRRFIGAD